MNLSCEVARKRRDEECFHIKNGLMVHCSASEDVPGSVNVRL